MGWSLRLDALRPFKIYYASPSITSQLVLFLWQNIEIGPLGYVRVVEALQNSNSDNLNECAIDKYKSDTGIYEAYHIQQNLSLLIVA